MNLPDIKKAELDGKRVLMRVDFNMEHENSKLKQTYRIKAVKDTINYILLKPGVKLALLSHLGRPLEDGKEGSSFKDIYKEIGKILGHELVFVPDCVGEGVSRALFHLEKSQVLMLENVRFYKGEEEGDKDFAERLAKNFVLYVNDAFSASHRDHASITKITEFLSSYVGFNLEEEVKILSEIRENFKKPAVAIVGGAKIETKLPTIDFFAKRYDKVLLGGKLGIEAKDKKMNLGENVILPKDYAGENLDIGQETVEEFKKIIASAKTIVWNGPMGQFENEEFAEGTKGIVEAIIANDGAFKVCGGGETIQFLENSGLFNKFNFVSTGGGAMLEFLAKGTLPGLESLLVNSKKSEHPV